MDFIRQTRQEGRIHVNFACEGFLGRYEAEVRDQFYRCHAGISVGSIRINGAISGCPSIRANYDQGNIYQDDFMEVWNNRFEKFRTGMGPSGRMCRLQPVPLLRRKWHAPTR